MRIKCFFSGLNTNFVCRINKKRHRLEIFKFLEILDIGRLSKWPPNYPEIGKKIKKKEANYRQNGEIFTYVRIILAAI